jgi:hypothetical protein
MYAYPSLLLSSSNPSIQTGRSDIPLTTHGEKVVHDGASRIVGDDRQ